MRTLGSGWHRRRAPDRERRRRQMGGSAINWCRIGTTSRSSATEQGRERCLPFGAGCLLCRPEGSAAVRAAGIAERRRRALRAPNRELSGSRTGCSLSNRSRPSRGHRQSAAALQADFRKADVRTSRCLRGVVELSQAFENESQTIPAMPTRRSVRAMNAEISGNFESFAQDPAPATGSIVGQRFGGVPEQVRHDRHPRHFLRGCDNAHRTLGRPSRNRNVLQCSSRSTRQHDGRLIGVRPYVKPERRPSVLSLNRN